MSHCKITDNTSTSENRSVRVFCPDSNPLSLIISWRSPAFIRLLICPKTTGSRWNCLQFNLCGVCTHFNSGSRQMLKVCPCTAFPWCSRVDLPPPLASPCPPHTSDFSYQYIFVCLTVCVSNEWSLTVAVCHPGTNLK